MWLHSRQAVQLLTMLYVAVQSAGCIYSRQAVQFLTMLYVAVQLADCTLVPMTGESQVQNGSTLSLPEG